VLGITDDCKAISFHGKLLQQRASTARHAVLNVACSSSLYSCLSVSTFVCLSVLCVVHTDTEIQIYIFTSWQIQLNDPCWAAMPLQV